MPRFARDACMPFADSQSRVIAKGACGLDKLDQEATPRWGKDHRDRKAMAIVATLQAYEGESVLQGVWVDLGCGSGGIVENLAPYVERIIGVDPEPWPDWRVLEAANNNVTFLIAPCDEREPPLARNSADVVICNQVYEHVSSPENLLSNIHSLLKPGGVCYFAGPNLLWPIEPHLFWPFIHWLPRRFAQRIMILLGSKQADLFDAHSTHFWKLTGWMKTSGFDVSEGLKMRLLFALENAKRTGLARMFSRIPRPVYELLHPASPGFVFILRKR